METDVGVWPTLLMLDAYYLIENINYVSSWIVKKINTNALIYFTPHPHLHPLPPVASTRNRGEGSFLGRSFYKC